MRSDRKERTGLEGALEVWQHVLGAERIRTDNDTLEHYERSTQGCPVRALAALCPTKTEQVVEIVKTAERYRVPLYPISGGRNWGYGDACPASGGNVIVDLSGMNRIVEVDADLAYAVIEPGVTQGQLSGYLRSNGIRLWPDCTGAGPDTSIVGNVLDRGFGHTPYGNRAQYVSGLEVVLPDGRVLRTGFGHYEGARSTNLFPYGVGPSLDGLFVQSSLGIVTGMGIWLMPEPEAYSLFLCSLERDEDIGRFVEDLRPLRLGGTLRSVIHMGNDLRAISGSRTYPRDLSPEGGPLSMTVRQRLRKKEGYGAWMLAGGLYGARGEVAAARREIRRRLAGPGRALFFFDQRKLTLLQRLSRPLSGFKAVAGFREKLTSVQSLYDMNRGIPSHRFLAGAYWRHRTGLPADLAQADPAQDGCGLLWLPPVLPFTGAAVRELLDLAEPIFAEHGFDFFITLSTVTERALSGIMTIAYDAEDPTEAKAAQDCNQALLRALMAAGFPPYRVGPQSLRYLGGRSEVFWDVVGGLKQAMDPGDVISPGRYDPRRAK